MSESYAITRDRAAAKRRKPPKRPLRPAPRPIPAGLTLAGALLYYVAASSAGRPLLIGLYALCVVLCFDELWRWWCWRMWSKWTGLPIKRQSRFFDIFDWVMAAWVWIWLVVALNGDRL